MADQRVSATNAADAPAESAFTALGDLPVTSAIDGTSWIPEALDGDPAASGQTFRLSIDHGPTWTGCRRRFRFCPDPGTPDGVHGEEGRLPWHTARRLRRSVVR